ncbi:unnamed protein product [Coccothraustes coccothraustes]
MRPGQLPREGPDNLAMPGPGFPHPERVPGRAPLVPGRLPSSQACPGPGFPHPERVPSRAPLIPSVSRAGLPLAQACPGPSPLHPERVPGQAPLSPSVSPHAGCPPSSPIPSPGTSRWSSRMPIAEGMTVKSLWKGQETPRCFPVVLPLALCCADELELGNEYERFSGSEKSGLFTFVGLKFLARYTDNFDLNLSVEGHRDNAVCLLCAGYQWNKQRRDLYEPGQLNQDKMKLGSFELTDVFLSGTPTPSWSPETEAPSARGIFHRDLKVENIFVKSSDINEVNEVKLNIKAFQRGLKVGDF